MLKQITCNLWKVCSELPEVFILIETQTEMETLKHSPIGLVIYLHWQELLRTFSGQQNRCKTMGKHEMVSELPVPSLAMREPSSSGDAVEMKALQKL